MILFARAGTFSSLLLFILELAVVQGYIANCHCLSRFALSRASKIQLWLNVVMDQNYTESSISPRIETSVYG